jgi:hypothetical protein
MDLFDGMLRSLVDALAMPTSSLTCLDLANTGISPAGVHSVASLLRRHRSLTEIDVSANQFGCTCSASAGTCVCELEGFHDLAEAVNKSQVLVSLRMSQTMRCSARCFDSVGLMLSPPLTCLECVSAVYFFVPHIVFGSLAPAFVDLF